jgi:hypothetical protein
MWKSLSVACDRLVVFSGYSGFFHLCTKCESFVVFYIKFSVILLIFSFDFSISLFFSVSILFIFRIPHMYVNISLIIPPTLCEKVCQWLATGWWFSQGTPVSSTNKTDCHDITEILLKVALNSIKQTNIILFIFRIPHMYVKISLIIPPHNILWSYYTMGLLVTLMWLSYLLTSVSRHNGLCATFVLVDWSCDAWHIPLFNIWILKINKMETEKNKLILKSKENINKITENLI